VFDLLNTGFTLLRIGGNAVGANTSNVAWFSAAAEARGIPFHVVDIASEAALDLYQRRLILVRPDQHVAWRGDRIPDDAGAVLDRVVGRM
jgi:hypothetical protein